MRRLHDITSAGRVPRKYLKFPTPTYYHIYTHVGEEISWFDREEKDYLVSLIKKLSSVFAVEVLTYAIMSNHYHIVIRTLGQGHMSDEEALRRAVRLYGLWRAGMRSGRYWKSRFCDISYFMKEINQRFSRWLNIKRGRRGVLWRSRFNSIVVEERFLLPVLVYIDLNPYKAGEGIGYKWVGFNDGGGWVKSVERIAMNWKEYKLLLKGIMEKEDRDKYYGIYSGKGIAFGSKEYVEKVLGSLPWRRRKREIGEGLMMA